MAIRTVRLENLEREVLVVGNGLVGEALRQRHIEVAREKLADEMEKQTRAFGSPLPYQQAVDGRARAPLDSVKVGGVIRFDFSALHEIVVDAEETLFRRSPWTSKQKTRRDWPHYRDSHLLFIDGVEYEQVPERIDPAAEVIFVNALPYSRRIELGWSGAQAPDGVYDATERELRSRWRQVAIIDFTYRGVSGVSLVPGRAGNKSGTRYPALVIKARNA